jgi:hypothetical protein
MKLDVYTEVSIPDGVRRVKIGRGERRANGTIAIRLDAFPISGILLVCEEGKKP